MVSLDRFRELAMRLPRVEELDHFGTPSFRVRGKIFAMPRQDDGRISVWCKAPPGSQLILIGADPERFFAPPYVGPKGWIGVRLDDEPDWSEVDGLVRRSYRLIAPRRLVAGGG